MPKLRAKKVIVDNILFDSLTEKNYYLYLKTLKRKGQVIDIQCHPTFTLQEKYIIVEEKVVMVNDPNFEKLKKIHKAKTFLEITYSPDFIVTYSDGHIEAIDVKGMETDVFKIKHKMFNYKYPAFKLIIIKYDYKTDAFYQLEEYNKLIKERVKQRAAKKGGNKVGKKTK